MDTAKRVLMICYFYPPARSVGGTRSVEFAKALSAFGWLPIVLSVTKPQESWSLGGDKAPEEVEVKYARELPFPRLLDLLHGCCSRVARLFGTTLKKNYFREYLAIPDSQLFWCFWPKAIAEARLADVIYVSCAPYSAALGAAVISRLTGKPLVVDLRDAWSSNPHIHRSPLVNSINRRLESFVLKQAKQVILNTDGALSLYQEEFPEYQKKFSSIYNGCDSFTPVTQTRIDHFTILHLGTFYGSRKPDLLLRAIKELPELGARFVQVGGSFELPEDLRSEAWITIEQSVTRAETQSYMQKASVLYLKQGWEVGVTNYIAVAAKTFEYISSGLPILAELPHGDNLELVKSYAQRSYLVTEPNDLEQMKRELMAAHRDWLQIDWNTRPTKPSQGNEEFKKRFDRKHLTRELSEVLVLAAN